MNMHCTRCGRKLTNPNSQERGMGPVCCPRVKTARVAGKRRGRKPKAGQLEGQLSLFVDGNEPAGGSR
jgi:hypothetical protein